MAYKYFADQQANGRRYYKKNKKIISKKEKKRYITNAEYLRNLRLSRKKQVFDHYGWRCNCCGELNALFLSLDHINNDGYKERKGRGGSSDQIFRNIINKGFPDTYQILCFNCNLGKARNEGKCPHLNKNE